MKKEIYYQPQLNESKFNCPHCGVYSKQFWGHISMGYLRHDPRILKIKMDKNLNSNWKISNCEHCGEHMIWLDEKIIYPDQINVDEPNIDLNNDIKKDYLEAANIFNKSPRGAAALLRLALQKLLKQLGEDGENINDDIKKLITKGLNPVISKALDFVRVTGNNAVHPGEIDLNDSREIAEKLFQVINFIAEKMITEPKEVEALFDSLPEKEKGKIDKRNDDLKTKSAKTAKN